MPKFNPPENFNFHNPSEWKEWKERFSRYRTATKLNKDDEEVQISALIYAMGREAEHVLKSFVFGDDEDDKKFDDVFKKFDDYFVPKKNTIHERARFHERKQNPGESVESFTRNLYELAENCDFKDKNDQIRDQLVIGILDKELSEKLQLQSELTLDKAIQTVRQSEIVKSQIKDQSTHSSKHLDAVKVQSRHLPSRHKQSSATSKQAINKQNAKKAIRGTDNTQCSRCNRRHGKNVPCPAKGQKCRACGKYNHFEVCCRTKEVREVVRSPDELDYEEFYLGSITCDQDEKPWEITLNINNTPVTFKIDTGADISVMSEITLNSLLKKPKLHVTNSVLHSPGGQLVCKGKFEAKTSFKNHDYCFSIFVIAGAQANNLLGRNVANRMNLVKRVEEVSVFGSCGLVKCKPVKITLREDAKPYCINTPRRVPFPILPKVEDELMRMEREGIIEKVTEPTEWCAPMVPVIKKNGKVRICVDLKKLNGNVKREHFMLPNLDDISPKLVGSTCFSKLDASSGFYQIPLHDDSAKLTTFITPFGRFCFRRVPFGITSAPEIFQREMSEMLQGLDGVQAIIDDVLIYGETREEHDIRLDNVMERIRTSGLKLNQDKCEFRKSKLEYFGHVIGSDGIRPNPERVRVIKELTAPGNVSELRRTVGMVNYLGRFLPNLSSVIKPLTDLLKSDVTWLWGPQQEKAFATVKEMLTDTPVLAYYDPRKEIVVSADASSYGLGAAIFQREENELKPIAYCSRTLSETETKYAQIEKECLAGVWACEKFARYLVGLPTFKLLTDHKPLVPLINKQDLDRTPLRCQRLLMRLRRFNVEAEYVAGKHLVVPDTLSRCPSKLKEDFMTDEIQLFVESVELSRPISDMKLNEICDATMDDDVLQSAIQFTKCGWPDRDNAVKDGVKDYFSFRNELSVVNGFLLYRNRIVVPESLRTEILDLIHAGHQGVTKCRERAATSVWWRWISADIAKKADQCDFCRMHRPTHRRELLKPTVLPNRPWQKISADLCEIKDKRYLVVIDYFSRYIEIVFLTRITSDQVIGKLKNIFARWGIPEQIVTDSGTQFTSATFKKFAKDYNFQQVFSSPHHHQANGEAESGVKIAKRILYQDDIFLALMSYRATPIAATGVSPAELIMGRKIRTTLPVVPEKLNPKWPDFKKVRENDTKMKRSYKQYYDRSSRPLPELSIGERVKIKLDDEKQWTNTGVVSNADYKARSYIIDTPQGKIRRNRRHLMPDTECVADQSSLTVTEDRNAEPTEKHHDAIPLIDNHDTDLRPINADVKITRSGRVVQKPKRFEGFVMN